MKVLKVPLKETEKFKKKLISEGLLDFDHLTDKDKEFFYFPIIGANTKTKKIKGAEIIEKEMREKERKETNLRDALQYYLTKDELKLLKSAYDIVGNIAILEIEKELEPKEEIIAEELMKLNKNVTTVVKKKGIHSGEFRLQETEYIAGKNTKLTIHKENNVRIKVNVDKTYFSIRLSTERKRIAELVKKGENILVMFSGCAPYPMVLSKNTEAAKIIGIEINPEAHKLGIENIKLNKVKNVTLINGEVKIEIPKLNEKFDRILMPLPKTADEFLKEALNVSKKGTIIHFYDFLKDTEFNLAHEKIEKACKEMKLKYKILETVKCGQHAPRIYRICVDFKIL